MFTGLVQDLGEVRSIDRTDAGVRLRIGSSLAGELRAGDSIAVSGACLTAARVGDDHFEADVMNQTLSLTTLGERAEGDSVNLELPVRAGDPLGGHIVQGHVDCVAEVAELREDGFARRLRIALPAAQLRYVVEHGSVTVDGVSLTVAGLTDHGFEVSLIPETLERTTLGAASEGKKLNIELDLIARYVERLLRFKETT